MTNYVEKEFKEIFEKFLTDSVEHGLISHAEDFLAHVENLDDISNFYVMSDAVYAKMFELAYQSMTEVYESDKIDYAEGEDLDNIGKTRGIIRPEHIHAMVEVTFYLNADSDEEVNIDPGIIVSTEDGIEYETIEPIYFSVDKSEVTVQCKSIEPGPDYEVLENTLTQIITNLDYDLTCTNNNNSSGGAKDYNDDEYRYLLLNWFKIHLKGSKEAYENYFANADGIDGYKLIPNFDVTGHTKIIVDPGTPYQLNQIYNDLRGVVAQFSEDLYLCAPEDILIDIYAVVNVDIDQINPYSLVEKEDIKKRIVQAIKTFIDGGYTSSGDYYEGLLIGEDFIPHKLAVFLDEEVSELKNITFNYPSDYIQINDEGKGKSNIITIEMI